MRRLLFENAGLKVSAILIAVLLWFFVTSRGQSEMSLDIPLEFKAVPAGLGIASSSVKTVNVTIKGQERLMKGLRPESISIYVDLEKAKRGEGTYYINKEDIKLPYAMAVTNVTPSSVRLRLEEITSRRVRVKPVVSGSAAPGYVLRSVDVDPREVVVEGLQSEVRKIVELKTETVDITGARMPVTQQVSIDAPGAHLKLTPAEVTVKAAIGGRRQ